MVVFAWLRVSILIMLCWTFSKTSSLQARVCKGKIVPSFILHYCLLTQLADAWLQQNVKSSLLFPADTSGLFLLSPGSPHHEEGSWASYYSGCILCMANDDQGLSTCQRVLSRFVRWLKNVKTEGEDESQA
ncbi:hypothetical protein PVAP13_7KG004636 [Panicum virgatum]|uniref:Secreted protein n=1 Tax=Panicum virgatum TaxID=38727 RepID=A0A8T0Q7E7_PANVG|nr:hypothetical protein PVAP13_7KG004636 [Panicum virgatum]